MNDPPRIFALATLLGALGMWLMLPRAAARGRMTGVVLAAGSLGLLASQALRWEAQASEVVFCLLACITVAAAVATVTLPNPVSCAIWLGISWLAGAALLLFAGAHFLPVATVVVYAGAILVTVLFVPAPAQPKGRAHYDRVSWEAAVSAVTGAVMVGILSMTVTRVLQAKATPLVEAAASQLPAMSNGTGTPEQQLAEIALLHKYLMVGALLFGVGMIGLLSRRNMIVMLLAAQLMLQGVVLSLVAWSRFHNDFGGQMLVIFIVALAACQAAVALALMWTLFRRSGKLDVAAWHALREANQPAFADEDLPSV